MKNLFLNTFAVLATLAVSAPLGLAQGTLTATVPFAFGIDARHVMPAGDYLIVKYGDRWQLSNRDSKNVAFLTGHPEDSRKTDPAELVFDCRSNICALRKIQVGGGDWGYYVPPVRARRGNALELARVVVVPVSRSEGN